MKASVRAVIDREDCDFFLRMNEYEEAASIVAKRKEREIQSFLNKLGLFFDGLREGDSYYRFERKVFNAHCDGLPVGDINHSRYFVECAMTGLKEIMQVYVLIILTSLEQIIYL